jgi:hypothetical protein
VTPCPKMPRREMPPPENSPRPLSILDFGLPIFD